MSEKKQERLLVLAIILVGLYYPTRAILWWGFGIRVPQDTARTAVRSITQKAITRTLNFVGEQVMKIN